MSDKPRNIPLTLSEYEDLRARASHSYPGALDNIIACMSPILKTKPTESQEDQPMELRDTEIHELQLAVEKATVAIGRLTAPIKTEEVTQEELTEIGSYLKEATDAVWSVGYKVTTRTFGGRDSKS